MSAVGAGDGLAIVARELKAFCRAEQDDVVRGARDIGGWAAAGRTVAGIGRWLTVVCFAVGWSAATGPARTEPASAWQRLDLLILKRQAQDPVLAEAWSDVIAAQTADVLATPGLALPPEGMPQFQLLVRWIVIGERQHVITIAASRCARQDEDEPEFSVCEARLIDVATARVVGRGNGCYVDPPYRGTPEANRTDRTEVAADERGKGIRLRTFIAGELHGPCSMTIGREPG